MLLVMMGLASALIIVGGLASLVALADARHARVARHVGPACLYAGAGALGLSLTPAMLFEYVAGGGALAGAAFFVGYVLGLSGGALLGLRRAASGRLR